mgnify:CR=1 FL=1
MKINPEKIEKRFGYLFVNGKYYDLISKEGKPIFTEDKNAINKINKAKEMAKKLEHALNKEAVLTESLMKLEKQDFEILYKSLKSNRKFKPKTRVHHCVDMKIGNFVLPIVD